MPKDKTEAQLAATNDDGKPKKWNEIPMPADEAAWKNWCAGQERTIKIILARSVAARIQMCYQRARSRLAVAVFPDTERTVPKVVGLMSDSLLGEDAVAEDLGRECSSIYSALRSAFPRLDEVGVARAASMGFAHVAMLAHADSPIWTEKPSAAACDYARAKASA